MSHKLAKMLLITMVCELIADNYHLTLSEARDRFYSSRTIKLLDDDESGLYGDSAWYIFSVYEDELKRKHDNSSK